MAAIEPTVGLKDAWVEMGYRLLLQNGSAGFVEEDEGDMDEDFDPEEDDPDDDDWDYDGDEPEDDWEEEDLDDDYEEDE